ncbi:SDR family NAD(P)-dependent oxidoreductase, partial [Acinetobacter baumannii]
DWNAILDTNLTGTLRACQIFGRHMIERRYGRIINIASLSTFVALYEVAAYSASKAAVGSLTKSLAIEWARHGVTVNAIAPGVF